MNKTEKKHLHIPEFVLKRKEMQDLKGGAVGTPGGSATCCDCGCNATQSAGCIDGSGVDLGKQAAKSKTVISQ